MDGNAEHLQLPLQSLVEKANETDQVWVKARSKTATAEVDSQHALNTREKKTLSVRHVALLLS